MEHRSYYLITPLSYTGAAVQSFTYHATESLVAGQIVEVSVGRRHCLGIVESSVAKPSFNTKNITRILDLPPLPADLVKLADWVSRFYAASRSSVWSTILPTGLERKRRPVKQKSPAVPAGLPVHPLTDEQARAVKAIIDSSTTTHLVQGVTGSGKTRLYMEIAKQSLDQGRSVIVLVPEITLTPQIVEQFETAFGEIVLSSHSKLTEATRHHIWQQAFDAYTAQSPRIIIGPRSCLFMPAHHLGLIVVDECHETTYKQEQHPRYHANHTAAYRAHINNAKLILGSATPGLNELFLAHKHRLEHIRLTQRTNKISQEKAKIIDLRDKDLLKSSKFIAQPILDAVSQTITDNRQSLLYLNRRGSASSQVCGDCGHVTACPNCLLPLTFHADLMRLICHHCNFTRANPAVCPECNGADLKLLGGGTKRIESEIAHLFPQARIARLDRDSSTLSHLHTVLRQLKKSEIDILIGTQMIAKGLDLPAIDTVGIISADTMLHLPDFTAAERTYQLISQVSGRAGRGDRVGQTYIQTYTPDHPAIRAAASNAYDDFAIAELEQRRALSYPPYVYLLKLTTATKTREGSIEQASEFANTLRQQPDLAVIGPAPAFIESQGQKYHWVIIVKSKTRSQLVAIANALPGPHWTADLDPMNLL